MNKRQKIKYKKLLKELKSEHIFDKSRWELEVEDWVNPNIRQGGMIPLGKDLGYLGIYYSPQLDMKPALEEVRNDIDNLIKFMQKHRNNPKVKLVKK